MVGVIGFEPTTPSSRTRLTGQRFNKINVKSHRNTVNGCGTSVYFRAVPVPAREHAGPETHQRHTKPNSDSWSVLCLDQ